MKNSFLFFGKYFHLKILDKMNFENNIEKFE